MRLLGLTTTHDAAALGEAALIVPDLTHVSVAVIERTGEWGPTDARLEISPRR
jgi:hypothetical protein